MMSMWFDMETIESFHRDGVVCLPSVIDTDGVGAMRSAVDDYLATGDRWVDLAGEEEGLYRGANFIRFESSAFRSFVFDSSVAEIACRLMRSTKVMAYSDAVFVKEAGSTSRTPWHTDMSYYPFTGGRECAFWIALDHVTPESGAVEYVRGSHQSAEMISPAAFGRAADPKMATTMREGRTAVPDIESNRDLYDIVSFELYPGDCVVHDGYTLHAAPGNHSQSRRRGLVLRWLDDKMTYTGENALAELPVDPGLRPGDPVECDLFPRVWPR